MNKTVKTGNVAVLLLGMILALASCGPKGEAEDPRTGSDGDKGTIYDKTVVMIDELRIETDWNKSQTLYADILNKWIPQLKKSPSQRRNLTEAAKIAYCHSMDTILYESLSVDCANLHKLMGEVYALRGDLNQFATVPVTALHNQVVVLYEEHQEMLSYVNSVRTKNYYKKKQTIKSIEDKYNEELEKAEINKAKGYQSKQPNCSEIIKGLKRVVDDKTAFYNWRKCYCEQLLDLYSKKTNRNEGDYNTLSGNLNKYFIRKFPNDSYTNELKGILESLRMEFEEDE